MRKPSFPDISHWQSTINYDLFPASKVVLKVSEPYKNICKCFTDHLFLYYQTLLNPHFQLSYYHYYRPNITGSAQADYFLHQLEGVAQHPASVDYLILDFEEIIQPPTYLNLKSIAVSLYSFCKRVQAMAPIPVMIYTRSSMLWYFRAFGLSKHIEWMKEYDLWLAAYPFEKRRDYIQNFGSYQNMIETDYPAPAVPFPWKKITWWQWTGHGRYPGIAGDVDLNVRLD